MFEATFWVAISFLIFIALLIYKKVPGLINKVLDDKISEIKKKVEEGVPLIGICLGMQMLFKDSTEFKLTPGLNLIDGNVRIMKNDKIKP